MADEKMGSSNKGQAWFCTTGLTSDVVIEVDDMTFHLHKFPLMSKSQKLHSIITEREQNPRARDQEDGSENEEEIEEVEIPHISLPNFPGGSETFEAAAKFCYHVKIDLTAGNAPALRCAAEYLEMTDEFSQDNLINRTERFLAHSVFRSLKSSVKALKSCESLSPMAEELGIVQRCIDSIAGRANANTPSSIFGWPIAEGGSGRDREPDRDRDLRVSIRRKSARNDGSGDGGADLWFEELSAISLPIYKRVLAAMKERDLSSEIIEGSLISYAKRSIPGLSRSNRHIAPAPSTSELEQRELLETIITNLPLEKSLVGSNTTRFLFRLLRTINILRASDNSRAALERKIGSQLEQATLDDLLMPSYSYLVETLYDVDSVERILNYFLEAAEEAEETSSAAIVEAARSPAARGESSDGMVRVGRLVDGYLAEIASDANLRPERFCDLAVALPDRARVYDDGLYRAVDLYLKAHPRISEEERDKICSVMDCRKLTLEACTHAAQNERLPLRAVVQVLFFEQLQLRHTIAGTLIAVNAAGPPPEEGPLVPREGETWRTAIRENQVLRLDMDSMQSRVQELERECSYMRKAIEKVGRKGERRTGIGPDRGSSVVRRFGCKFGTKVCDSQERTVLEPRKSQAENQNNP